MITGIAIGTFGTLLLLYIVAAIEAYRSASKESRRREEVMKEEKFKALEEAHYQTQRDVLNLNVRLSKLVQTCYDEGKGDEK
jgi:hypothetical protein